jgi:hypothetical protein
MYVLYTFPKSYCNCLAVVHQQTGETLLLKDSRIDDSYPMSSPTPTSTKALKVPNDCNFITFHDFPQYTVEVYIAGRSISAVNRV